MNRRCTWPSLKSEYVLSGSEDGSVVVPSEPNLLQSSALGDVAIVPDGTGPACRGMIQQQAGSVGCPALAAEVERLGMAPTADGAGKSLPTLLDRLLHQHEVSKRRTEAPKGKWLPTFYAQTRGRNNC